MLFPLSVRLEKRDRYVAKHQNSRHQPSLLEYSSARKRLCGNFESLQKESGHFQGGTSTHVTSSVPPPQQPDRASPIPLQTAGQRSSTSRCVITPSSCRKSARLTTGASDQRSTYRNAVSRGRSGCKAGICRIGNHDPRLAPPFPSVANLRSCRLLTLLHPPGLG